MIVNLCEEIDAPVEKCWDFVGDFGKLYRWHPGITACTLDGELKAGVVRTLTTGDKSLKEKLLAYDPPNHALTYAIQPGSHMDPYVGMEVSIKLTAAGPNKTKAEWNVFVPDGHANEAGMIEMAKTNYPKRIAALREYSTKA